MNEEYTYNIGKYTIGVDTNGEDGIGLTVTIINDDGEIHFLGNCYGDNAMCIDLLIKENQQLKEQVEYMRRSIERKEETITELEQEKVPYTNEYVKKLEKANKEAIHYIRTELLCFDNESIEYIEGLKILNKLDIDKGE